MHRPAAASRSLAAAAAAAAAVSVAAAATTAVSVAAAATAVSIASCCSHVQGLVCTPPAALVQQVQLEELRRLQPVLAAGRPPTAACPGTACMPDADSRSMQWNAERGEGWSIMLHFANGLFREADVR